tara:strand:- start:3039 stop:3665 length:627 start_codon:yes stop_codon:yes gene_type:complete
VLNIQIRGFLAKMSIFPITREEKDVLLDNIRDTKMTLSEILKNTNNNGFDKSFELSFPMVTHDSEIIITSFAEHDYYNDGYSFFREQLDLLTDKASDYNGIVIDDYGLINKSIHYGCSFEADLNGYNYQTFNEDKIDIETIKIPVLDKTFIKNIFYSNQKLENTSRSKIQHVKNKSILFKKINEINKKFIENSENSKFEIITYSESVV